MEARVMKTVTQMVVDIIGGPTATGRLLGVRYQTVARWYDQGHLPRNELIDEVYAHTLATKAKRIGFPMETDEIRTELLAEIRAGVQRAKATA